MNCNTNIKPISFWTLINECSIQIPIIQRDYAQGRSDIDTSKKRIRFLEALHNALLPNRSQTLDFVYGEQNGNVLQPLDGQQRLTTLFLLHWFIATKEGKMDEITKEKLSRFSYETRTSSREFCEKLITEGCSIAPDKKVSTTIKDHCNWWVLSWEKDPTIKAMLCMLDEIKNKFTEDNLWDRLIGSHITFINIPLRDFGLSDDLYVKMNARGKQLTIFENWKAEFEKHISIQSWEENIHLTDTFAYKMDTIWTDLFWKYNIDNKIDTQILNFIRRTQLFSVLLDKSNTRTLDDKTTLDNFPYYDPQMYQNGDFDYLCLMLNIWKDADKNCALNWFDDKIAGTLFETFIDETVTYPGRVLFFAQTLALKKGLTLNSHNALNWMRVVRNIVKNSTIDSIATLKGALLLIEEIGQGCDNIYGWLADNEISSNFAAVQVKEEQLKARLVCYNTEWELLLFRCEDTSLCQGKISFALHCSDYNDTPASFNNVIFEKIILVIKNYFSEVTVSLWRAFLTIDDSKFYTCWSSWSYQVDCPKRWMPNTSDELRRYCNNEYTHNNNGSQHYAIGLVKALLDMNLDEYLSNYSCPSNMPIWKQELIKGDKDISKCTKGYLCVSDDESKCWLIDGQKPSDLSKYHKMHD